MDMQASHNRFHSNLLVWDTTGCKYLTVHKVVDEEDLRRHERQQQGDALEKDEQLLPKGSVLPRNDPLLS